MVKNKPQITVTSPMVTSVKRVVKDPFSLMQKFRLEFALKVAKMEKDHMRWVLGASQVPPQPALVELIEKKIKSSIKTTKS